MNDDTCVVGLCGRDVDSIRYEWFPFNKYNDAKSTYAHMICVAEDADRENNFTRNSDVRLCAANFNTYKFAMQAHIRGCMWSDSKCRVNNKPI